MNVTADSGIVTADSALSWPLFPRGFRLVVTGNSGIVTGDRLRVLRGDGF